MKFLGYFTNFIKWYYLKGPLGLLKIWGDFLKFFTLYLFSLPQLVKSLFSPWKRTNIKIRSEGLDLGIFFQNLSASIASRITGFLARLILIATALIIITCVFALGLVLFVFWLVWPVVLIYSIVYSLQAIIFFSLLFSALPLCSYIISKEKAPEQMTLKEILSQKWGTHIWERLGLEPKKVPKEVIKNPQDTLGQFLNQQGLTKEDFNNVLVWEISKHTEEYLKKRFWRRENLFAVRSLTQSWIYGYTPLLKQYSRPIAGLAKYERLVGYRQEIEALERILSKEKQANALIVGEPGVGKMNLVQKFGRLINSGRVPKHLAEKKLIILDLKQALAGLDKKGLLEKRLIGLFNEARLSGNTILVINDFHHFLGAGASGFDDKNETFVHTIKPFLESGRFQLIAVTTYKGLHRQIEKTDLMNYFEKLEIKEPDKETTIRICQDSVREIERRVPVRITVQAIDEAVEKSDLYITDKPFPQKALDLLEEAAIYAALKTSDRFVKSSHVNKVVSQITEIPAGELEKEEKEKLLNLETLLHKRIINQEEAVAEIAGAMRRTRLGIGSKKRPIGSFLFLGPTGVGKTETAKALAETYFGSEEKINRFDMSEFQGNDAVEKMIGSTIKTTSGVLTTAVKENPFSLLLLDEFEKADYGVLNLFLQVLEDGFLTDALSRKINFKNQIIIATSNAGADFIWKKAQEKTERELLKKELINHIVSNRIFSPELLNRFDDVVIYKPLEHKHLVKIAELMLNNLKRRLAENNLVFQFNQGLAEKIAELGYKPAYGARPMRRIIQKKVEDLIAKKLLRGEVKKGEPFKITETEI
jgi:ATP-dependent Clp protease ATP-binding subunit ClpC